MGRATAPPHYYNTQPHLCKEPMIYYLGIFFVTLGIAKIVLALIMKKRGEKDDEC